MRREKSQQSAGAKRDLLKSTKAAGTLYLVGVPIGHPDDITVRALAILSQVDVVATEDPGATQTLLQYHNLSVPLTSYGPTKINEKVPVLIHRLLHGSSVALLSDCGTPLISDPGCLLVTAAHQNNIAVRSIPGPSAVTATIAASGFPAEAFHFYGEIAIEKHANKRRLLSLLNHAEPTILFCQTTSCLAILDGIAAIAPRRQVALACNLTVQDENVLRGTARRVASLYRNAPRPHTVTIILSGRKDVTSGRASKLVTRSLLS
jgi:16S rRNA (cytidine1402-2'-O)-methyltransferase